MTDPHQDIIYAVITKNESNLPQLIWIDFHSVLLNEKNSI